MPPDERRRPARRPARGADERQAPRPPGLAASGSLVRSFDQKAVPSQPQPLALLDDQQRVHEIHESGRSRLVGKGTGEFVTEAGHVDHELLAEGQTPPPPRPQPPPPPPPPPIPPPALPP